MQITWDFNSIRTHPRHKKYTLVNTQDWGVLKPPRCFTAGRCYYTLLWVQMTVISLTFHRGSKRIRHWAKVFSLFNTVADLQNSSCETIVTVLMPPLQFSNDVPLQSKDPSNFSRTGVKIIYPPTTPLNSRPHTGSPSLPFRSLAAISDIERGQNCGYFAASPCCCGGTHISHICFWHDSQ